MILKTIKNWIKKSFSTEIKEQFRNLFELGLRNAYNSIKLISTKSLNSNTANASPDSTPSSQTLSMVNIMNFFSNFSGLMLRIISSDPNWNSQFTWGEITVSFDYIQYNHCTDFFRYDIKALNISWTKVLIQKQLINNTLEAIQLGGFSKDYIRVKID